MHGLKAIGRFNTFGSQVLVFCKAIHNSNSTVRQSRFDFCSSKKSMVCPFFLMQYEGTNCKNRLHVTNVKPVYLDDDGSKSLLCVVQNCK